ncbi:Protein of unknown function DUF295 [Macleaya cordata]|uniref:KIB1-4 beta-propeller domain-containing protein n=1 Tax=Macleaya cordata TaxID=56857 RepID=A0A200QCH3_MACCD|nr:Protein of unknown function DUF295 [Macleaya cordata]
MEEKLPAAAAAAKRSERRRPPVPRAAPWLVFPYGNGEKDQAFYNLCDPNKKTYRKCIPEMSRKSYWQSPSHQGWLVILCDDEADSTLNLNYGDCFLWNPVSLETIQLPTLLHWLNKSDQYFVRDCVLSSPPTNPDSMVFFLFSGDDDTSDQLVFCGIGDDKQWRTEELLSFHVINEIPRPLVLAYFTRVEDYYVESCDELFMVSRFDDPRTPNKQVTTLLILRMDFSLMAWEEVKDLGDHVFFLGKKTTACCSAAELGLTRGCVYFTLPHNKSLYKFDLEEGTIAVDLPCPNLPTPWFSPNWMIIIPTTVRETDGRRRPEDMLGKNNEEDIIKEAEEIKTSTQNDNKVEEEEEEEEEAQKNNGGELEEAGTWGSLNVDILELIARYLHPVDYLHFRAVCKENRSAIPAVSWRTSSAEITQTTYLSPWLVFYKKNDGIYNFLDPMHNKEKYIMDLQDLLLDAKIRFSKGGWLLMSKGKKTLFFFNPFTRAMIQLPDLPDDENYGFSGISFSSLPTCSDCVVFASPDIDSVSISILFISRGDDSWRSYIINYNKLPLKEKCMPCRNNPVFYNGVFYCLDYKGALGAFDLNDDDYTWKFLDNPQRPCNSIYQSFLVECEGKLLSVFLGHLGKWVRIFRLDFSRMVWVEVESLGRHMLFVSHTSCLSTVAPDNQMKNKIYFPRFHGEGRIIFYSLDTGRYHCHGGSHSSQDFYNTKEQLYCSWIEPNWSQTTDQELDWRFGQVPWTPQTTKPFPPVLDLGPGKGFEGGGRECAVRHNMCHTRKHGGLVKLQGSRQNREVNIHLMGQKRRNLWVGPCMAEGLCIGFPSRRRRLGTVHVRGCTTAFSECLRFLCMPDKVSTGMLGLKLLGKDGAIRDAYLGGLMDMLGMPCWAIRGSVARCSIDGPRIYVCLVAALMLCDGEAYDRMGSPNSIVLARWTAIYGNLLGAMETVNPTCWASVTGDTQGSDL